MSEAGKSTGSVETSLDEERIVTPAADSERIQRRLAGQQAYALSFFLANSSSNSRAFREILESLRTETIPIDEFDLSFMDFSDEECLGCAIETPVSSADPLHLNLIEDRRRLSETVVALMNRHSTLPARSAESSV